MACIATNLKKRCLWYGFVVNIKGQKSHDIIDDGLRILERLEHRGGAGADKGYRRWCWYLGTNPT